MGFFNLEKIDFMTKGNEQTLFKETLLQDFGHWSLLDKHQHIVTVVEKVVSDILNNGFCELK